MTITESVPSPPGIKIDPKIVDKEGFATIWNVAASSSGDELESTRALAAKLLCFLSKNKASFVVTSSTNAEYLDEWFEKDKKLLNNWKPESEFVDVVAQHAEVPANALLMFLDNSRWNPESKHNSTRAQRLEWFQEMWNVG